MGGGRRGRTERRILRLEVGKLYIVQKLTLLIGQCLKHRNSNVLKIR